ncbi:MAG: tRNA lysidine(34) synthetase TilS [Oscillospiraceae bacterium]|nr:tRNA lysidine(34) synthetase TilS [Oscillospiraceae bacterium]
MLKKTVSFADKYGMLPDSGTVLAAVSGGADSMCLLHVLVSLGKERGFQVQAAHFNHMLRGREADRDERFVLEQCEKIGVPCHVGREDVLKYAKGSGMGTEEAGRKLRYDFFYRVSGETGASRIATAHNGDDNCETVIMNLLRGTGINGLCGIPPVRGMIIRPLLAVSRAEIETYLSDNGIPHVEDSTNESDDYTRNRIRHSVIPALKEINPGLTDSVEDMIKLLSADRDCLDDAAEGVLSEGVTVKKLRELPEAVASRVVRKLAPAGMSRVQTESVLRLVKSGEASGSVDLTACRAVVEYDRLYFTDCDDPGGFEPFGIYDGFDRVIPELGLRFRCREQWCDRKFNKSFNSFMFKTEGLCGTITVRPRKEGDRLTVAGRNVTKTLKKLMIEERIPPSRRSLVPVFQDDGGVIAALGLGQDPRTVAGTGDRALFVTAEEV